MLLLSGRSPNKILVAKDTGKVFQLDLLPLYGERGLVERMEVVPLRLTRNLSTFFTAFGVEGVFTTAMAAAAGALLVKDSNFTHVLSMFFREDLLAYWSRRGGKAHVAAALKNEQLKGLVVNNTRKVRMLWVLHRTDTKGGLYDVLMKAGESSFIFQVLHDVY